MPNFERFDKRSVPVTNRPTMTIQRGGTISINRPAFAMLGEPAAVELLFDREEQIVGLRRADAESPYAYPCHPQGPRGTVLVNATKFFAHYGAKPDVARRYPANQYGDGVVGIDLKEESIEVTGPRLKKAPTEIRSESPNGGTVPIGEKLEIGAVASKTRP